MRRVLSVISTIPILLPHSLLHAQGVTTKTLPDGVTQSPVPPDLSTIPFAVPLPAANPDRVVWDADLQTMHGSLYSLSGDVDIRLRGRRLQADTIEYNSDTGDLDARGHVRLTDTSHDASIQASRATYNLRSGTGKFFDAAGSVGLHRAPSSASNTIGLQNNNPFLFSGRIVEKTGPDVYTIYDGTVTSCQLPHPDWLFSSHRLAVNEGKVTSSKATFRLLGMPLLFFPYLSAPVAGEQRQSGLLIPELPSESTTKGIMTGEQVYFTLGRSADLTMGMQYFSQRGFSESGTFRYRGTGLDFVAIHGNALQDRGYFSTPTTYVQQGGQDITAAIRKQFAPNLRLQGDGEYLSSYAYREAFTSNFNQAVSSDINSIAFLTQQTQGWSVDGRVDRYQGLKQVQQANVPQQQIHILHVPSFDVDGIEHPIPGTPLRWQLAGSAAGLKRVQPDFTSAGIVERVDFRPELSLPLHFNGWNLRASLATRETFYSRSRTTPPDALGAPPVEVSTPINRADLEMEVKLRPPVLEREFTVPARLQNVFGTELRHTIEPEITYRDVRGVNNFLNVLRFDDVDLVSDTNEVEYGVTQHLYFRPKPRPTPKVPEGCPAPAPATTGGGPAERAPSDQEMLTSEGEQPAEDQQVPDVLSPTPSDSNDANGIPSPGAQAPALPRSTSRHHASRCTQAARVQQPLISWRLTQKAFIDPTFGNAVLDNRRNIFQTTLALSGIAFLTEPRNISPLISRLRVRTSGHTDAEWDFDYDTGAKKFTSLNVFYDAHVGNWFGGTSYARLNAPGRFTSEVASSSASGSGTVSAISNFSQLRLLLGYGVPTKPGLSIAANTGLDLIASQVQYTAAQSSYNWNCCGLSFEYRRYNLGTVRDENSYRFAFTLANIGSAGNIRRAERLF